MQKLVMLLYIVLGVLIIWFLFGTIIPYLLLAWYLRTSRISKSEELLRISKKLKKSDKEKTLKNVYKYIVNNYEGDSYQLNPLNLLQLRNFTLKEMLKKRKFLWCYSHIKLLYGLLVSTGQFSRKDIKIKWEISRHLAIHQYSIIKIEDKKYRIDPFYKIFKKV